MRETTIRVALAIVAIAACGASAGCSVIVDGAIEDRDGGNTGGTDGGMMTDCTDQADGTACGGGRICVSGACAISRCGDGVIDEATGEQCDDANDVADDGCEPDDCRFTCADHTDCDDGLPCTGEETCSAEHTCVAGTPLANGDECVQPSSEAGVCRGTDCVPAGCGNGVIADGEECDDGNTTDGDGCDADCTYSCKTDEECDDASVCTGTETCDLDSHTCVPGTPLTCDDSDVCTQNECDAERGCVYPLIDMDGDGYASDELGACGTDCNDMRADVNPGAPELCDDALDSNCDGNVNPTTINIWYLDCDGDGYAPAGAASMQACNQPPPTPCGGGWTTRVPVAGDRSTFDCNDGNALVRPGATFQSVPISGAATSIDYDYDCNLTEERQYTLVNVTSSTACTTVRSTCTGSGWVGATAPVCGASGSFSPCNYNALTRSCTRLGRPVTRTQACR